MNRKLLLAAAPLLAWSAVAGAAPPAPVTPPAPSTPVPGAPAFSAPAPSPPVLSPLALSPGEIVAAAPAADWSAIAPADLLVMDLAPGGAGRNGGKLRRVVIQLMPPPFAQRWIGNIRRLAAAHWWDGTSVNRVQDNYVVQWGDADGEDAAKARKLPDGMVSVQDSEYLTPAMKSFLTTWGDGGQFPVPFEIASLPPPHVRPKFKISDPYAGRFGFSGGMPFGIVKWEQVPVPERNTTRTAALSYPTLAWPVHCYGMVGVGRNLSPDTGSGAELYTVIGHAPRHLDRNIALVGRVIEGIEFLSSLPRGTGALGFYETPEERTPIVSVRLGNEVPGLPAYQYLSTESVSFARYADARANRRDPFFIRPAGGADICNIPVPVRRAR